MSNDDKTIPADYVFKPGDRVELILETLDSPDYDRFRVGVANFGSWCVMSGAQLRTGRLLPRPFKVGDLVDTKTNQGGPTGRIIAMDGKEVWVRWADGTSVVWQLSELVYAP